MKHISSCLCGQLTLEYQGEMPSPSICHCYSCQKRTGSVFSAQFRLPTDTVKVSGDTCTYLYTGDEGGKATMHFCPKCGSTLYWIYKDENPNDIIATVGGFANKDIPPPRVSVYGKTRKHSWVSLPESIEEHWD